uniref:C-C motif chemokine n=1 Tax=Pelusios castaneus TaxID=367368 RepID=A0A8C8SBT3_9SAUR
MKVSVAALAVLLIKIVTAFSSSLPDGVNTPTSCCFSYVTKQIPRNLVVKYRHTSSKCSLPAVIFTTRKGREICSDPNAEWVQAGPKVSATYLWLYQLPVKITQPQTLQLEVKGIWLKNQVVFIKQG